MTAEQTAAIEAYRAARAALDTAADRADAAFMRWFTKRQRGERTSGAAATRLSNEANWLSTDLHQAQSLLYKLDLDPWAIDDQDGHARMFV